MSFIIIIVSYYCAFLFLEKFKLNLTVFLPDFNTDDVLINDTSELSNVVCFTVV